MFVRKKKVKGQHYGYLVKNKWTSKGPRQKVIKYLGKVHKISRQKEQKIDPILIKKAGLNELIDKLVERELQCHGFELIDGYWHLSEVKVHPKGHVSYKGRKAVLEINEGFLCRDTIRQLKTIVKEPLIEPAQLASAILEAGISIEGENFAQLFMRISPETQF